MKLGAALLLVALASPAAASEDISPEARAQLTQLGVFAYTAGLCEWRMQPADTRQIHELVTGEKIRLHPDDEVYRPLVTDMMKDLYLKGIADPTRKTVSAETCQKLLTADINAMKARAR